MCVDNLIILFSSWIDPFIITKGFSFSIDAVFDLKSTLSYVSIAIPASLCLYLQKKFLSLEYQSWGVLSSEVSFL